MTYKKCIIPYIKKLRIVFFEILTYEYEPSKVTLRNSSSINEL